MEKMCMEMMMGMCMEDMMCKNEIHENDDGQDVRDEHDAGYGYKYDDVQNARV